MTQHTGYLRRTALLLALLAAASTITVPRISHGQTCDQAEPKIVQPLESTTLQVARVAGNSPSQSDYWEMKIDAFVCTDASDEVGVPDLKVEHLDRGAIVKTQYLDAYTWDELYDENLTSAKLPAQTMNRAVYYRNKDLRNMFPLPQQLRLTFAFDLPYPWGRHEVEKTYYVTEHRNPGLHSAYFFPFRQADLPSSHHWMQHRHWEINNHQRWAYDLVLKRWDAATGTWSAYRAGTSGGALQNHLSFDQPVYAMSDGEIIGCNRGAVDNPIGSKIGNVAGGNLLWVRTGNETTLYAHFKQLSIPYDLCPFSDDAEHKLASPTSDPPTDVRYRIKAGQYLGRTGSSGYSQGGPHLHIHAFKGLPKIWGGSEGGIDSDARPMKFINGRAQIIDEEHDVDEDLWNEVDHAIAPYDSRIEPNGCGFYPADLATQRQVVNIAIPNKCFSDMYNALVQAGMRPTFVDFGDPNITNTVWRPVDGIPWVALWGLDAAGVTAAHNEWFLAKGYRYLQVEAYEQGGAVRHALIFVRQGGGAQWFDPAMTATQLQSTFDTRTAQGYRPLMISATDSTLGARYSALYEQIAVSNYTAKPGIPFGSFNSEFNAEAAAGRKMVYADVFDIGASRYVSAVFYGGLDDSYEASVGITAGTVASKTAAHLENNSFMRSVASYLDGSTRRYLTLWRSAPDTTITSKPPAYTSSQTATFAFAANYPAVTYECRLDIGAWTTCTSPRSYAGLSPGPHAFQVRARDWHGIYEVVAASAGWFIDLSPPTVQVTRPRVGYSYVFDTERAGSTGTPTVFGAVTVRAEAHDIESLIDLVRFKVDGRFVDDSLVRHDSERRQWWFRWSGATPGSHTIQAIAYNSAGLATPSAVRSVTVVAGLETPPFPFPG